MYLVAVRAVIQCQRSLTSAVKTETCDRPNGTSVSLRASPLLMFVLPSAHITRIEHLFFVE